MRCSTQTIAFRKRRSQNDPEIGRGIARSCSRQNAIWFVKSPCLPAPTRGHLLRPLICGRVLFRIRHDGRSPNWPFEEALTPTAVACTGLEGFAALRNTTPSATLGPLPIIQEQNTSAVWAATPGERKSQGHHVTSYRLKFRPGDGRDGGYRS
jgi:hypothetical protein